MKVTVKNGRLGSLFSAFAAICAAGAPGWLGVRAYRNRKTTEEAGRPVSDQEQRIALAHGGKLAGGGWEIPSGAPSRAAHAELRALYDDEVELELQEIPLADLEALRMERAGDHIGLLIELGIATEPEGPADDEIPAAIAERAKPARSSKANGRKPARA